MRLTILADDLTGACGTGIQFVDQGFCVSVKTNNDCVQASEAKIVIVSTASRSDSPLPKFVKLKLTCCNNTTT
ncbi:MAG: four-carbon acid sugar kinase family protein [Pirellulaceae bacterium]|nr:four-carbon acid sugar kinase family protein [Pirellulaceae bacterium]